MASEIQILLEMGFEKERAKKALMETGNRGVEQAMEWLLSHLVEVDIQENNIESQSEAVVVPKTMENAKSLKCEDCNKLFSDVVEAEYHAAKSGHSNFSECTDAVVPLSEEEKQAQLNRVQEMLKQRRKEREEKERQEHLEREKARRVMGKEHVQTKETFEEAERKKMIAQKKREKEEEKLARQRVLEQIENDKRDRENKFPTSSSRTTTKTATIIGTTTTTSSVKDYTETRIQIRLQNGDKLNESFSTKETLAAVRAFVQQKSPPLLSVSFTFETLYPRKEFNEDDMKTPLKYLDLVPSAVLMVKML